MVQANVSSTKFDETLEAFDARCGKEARARLRAFIFNNQTASNPLSKAAADEVGSPVLFWCLCLSRPSQKTERGYTAQVDAAAMARVGALVAKAHRRRSAILSLIKCVAQGGLPLEASALDTCALAAVRLCRGSQV
jgi:hypothetical protein